MVASDGRSGKPRRHPKAKGDRRVQVSPGDITQRINHCQHDQSKGEGNPGVGDGSPARLVDDNGPRASKHESKRADELRRAGFHLKNGDSSHEIHEKWTLLEIAPITHWLSTPFGAGPCCFLCLVT